MTPYTHNSPSDLSREAGGVTPFVESNAESSSRSVTSGLMLRASASPSVDAREEDAGVFSASFEDAPVGVSEGGPEDDASR